MRQKCGFDLGECSGSSGRRAATPPTGRSRKTVNRSRKAEILKPAPIGHFVEFSVGVDLPMVVYAPPPTKSAKCKGLVLIGERSIGPPQPSANDWRDKRILACEENNHVPFLER